MTRTLLCLLVASVAVQAADQNPVEAKLRESLRSTMLQMRTVQGERDVLAAEKAALEQEKKSLADQVATLTKQSAADRDAAEKSIATLTERSNGQAAELMETRATLEKWKGSHAEVTQIAKTKESARATLAAQAIELKRKVADQQTRNLGMYRVAREVLNRYEGFSLGTALAAREPFTGNMKVKLETLAQDLGDQLDAQRIRPEPAAPAAPGTSETEKKRPAPAAARQAATRQ